ncbi:MAG: glutamine synthetase III [Chlamydiales bacterium]|nr:glutamine synthetase III [Chlamydiales bacterium]
MNTRQAAIARIDQRKSEPFKQERPINELFGENCFDEAVQKEYLESEVFEALRSGKELDAQIADKVAAKMKEWAVSRGATHFCHWFQPLTDLTAEKHDSLFGRSKEGGAIARFNGEVLIRGEPDASSFPNGGLRTTFEARGYTAWDASSPAFIFNNTLMIPTMFLSWKGEALDKKTPLIRSMDALGREALRILRLFGDKETERVTPTLAGEQEFFLIDKNFYHLRPDLITTGRTLFGARPPKGQELEDQYFGVIPSRILNVMSDIEYELMRVGVPVQTRHNEVAPAQYEIALNYQSANLASDQHMLLMELLCKVADRHGMACLLHEKPFAGINGSGKHSNWSMATDTGRNLLEPGESPRDNAQFLLFCAAVVQAVYNHAPMLRCAVASASNDHRLGMHEAPPGIISVFLGSELVDVFEQLIRGEKRGSKGGGTLQIGVAHLPHISRHSGDRNRTSPFAFTGNKFEFRAVGSMANLGKANTVLNSAVAQALKGFADRLEKACDFEVELQSLLGQAAREFWPVVFEGDNYNAEWHEEARKRGLPNVLDTVTASDAYMKPETQALFEEFGVYSKSELEGRREIMLEKYVTHIGIEARMASDMVHTQIFPGVLSYVLRLGKALEYAPKVDHSLLQQIEEQMDGLKGALEHLDMLMPYRSEGDLLTQACFARDEVIPALNSLRSYVDTLELLVDDNCWPLPKYHEMLFIR